MSLARVKVWIPGDVLTAADLNGEFNNIINNPITLISPSTGAINFNLQAHTNLLPSVITATGGSAGQALISTGGTTVSFGTPSVGSASLTGFTSGDTPVGTSSGALSAVSIGTTGKVYAVTSSNSTPAWQVIPPDGGLSTTVPSTGMVYYISTSGVLKGLTAGTSGQVLTLSTNIVPTWATPSASGGGSGSVSAFTWTEDWKRIQATDFTFPSTTSTSLTSIFGDVGQWTAGVSTGAILAEAGFAGAISIVTATGPASFRCSPTVGPSANVQYFSSYNPTVSVRWTQFSTNVGQRFVGLTSGTAAAITTSESGVYLLSTAGSATVSLFCISSSGASSLSAGVTASSFHDYVIAITTSQVSLTVDGAAVGSVTGNIWSSKMFPMIAYLGDPRPNNAGVTMDYFSISVSSSIARA